MSIVQIGSPCQCASALRRYPHDTTRFTNASHARLPSTLPSSLQEVALFEDIQVFTLETIARAMLRDYATDAIMSDILRIAPVHFNGAFSIPCHFPWPLSRLPLFSFGRSMKAREEFVSIMKGMLDERRKEMKSTTAPGGSDKQRRNAGVLGSFLDLQAKQRDANEPGEGKVEIDDDYIIANVSKLVVVFNVIRRSVRLAAL